MDKLKELYQDYLGEILTESTEKLGNLPEWKLDSYLLNSSSKSKAEKIKVIQEKSLTNDIVYSILIEDLNQLKSTVFEPTSLKILSIDDRLLEANGYTENKKERVYFFISEVLNLIEKRNV